LAAHEIFDLHGNLQTKPMIFSMFFFVQTSRFGTPQANKAKLLPPNERLQSRWNADPWDLTGVLTSPGGSSETDPGAFLLAYWMARFHGLIVAAEQEAV
jgi:hypothetical protein